MNNHFYMPYLGFKIEEIENTYNSLNFDNIKFIVEPGCGSCAISYYISTKKKGLTYILNDKNKYLLEMYNIIINDEKRIQFENDYKQAILAIDNKESYIKYIKEDGVLNWFIKHKYYGKVIEIDLNLSSCLIYNFFKKNKIIFTSKDGFIVYDKYETNDKAIILSTTLPGSNWNCYYGNSNLYNIPSRIVRKSIIKKNTKANIW